MEGHESVGGKGDKAFVGLHGEPNSAVQHSIVAPDSAPGIVAEGMGRAVSSGIRKGRKPTRPKRSVSWSHVALSRNAEQVEEYESTNATGPKRSDLGSILRHYGLDNGTKIKKSSEGVSGPQKRSIASISEHSKRLAAFGVGLTTTLSDVILIYPCLVLRRQCQVSYIGRRYHLTPFTIVGVAVSLQRSQGITCLWKGVGSHLMTNALSFGIESGLNEMSEKLPREVHKHSKLKDLVGHVILKAISSAILMPFYSAHLVESIQSEAASETPGIFYFLTEGFSRLFGFAGVQSPRLLPFRRLLLPTVIYFLIKYIFSSCLQYGILSAFRFFERRRHESDLSNARPFSPTDSAYVAVPGTSSSYSRSLVPVATSPASSQHHELLSTFISQLVTDVFLYPYETVLFRLHVQGTRTIIDDMDRGVGFLPASSRYEGYFDCLSAVTAYEGSAGLYRGFGALMLQYSMKFGVFKFLHFLVQTSSATL